MNLDYDSSFLFAAVNADYVTWIHYSNKRKERIYSDTRKIGKFISTKAVGTNSRVDVTANYKYPEGKLYSCLATDGQKGKEFRPSLDLALT